MQSTPSPIRKSNLTLRPALAWLSILGLVFLSAILLLGHAGSLLRFAFPTSSFLIGVLLYWRYPLLYSGFTWWLWFLTPWVRRLIDQQAGWQDPNLVLLTPFLVTLISFITFVRCLPKLDNQGSIYFVLPIASVFYSLLVGLVKNSPTAVVVPYLNWLTPITFGFHLFANWQSYLDLRQNTQRVFFWCVLVTGIYGIVQFFVAPSWDQYWMRNAPINTIGKPEPLQIRVFSTMNSPGPFASVLMAGLLMLLSSREALLIPAYASGYLSFLLSSARGAWGGWLVGLLTLVTNLKPRLQMRLVVVVALLILFIVPLTFVEPFSSVIFSRLETFSNIENDTSYQERQARYARIVGLALVEFLGRGMGGNPEQHIDSGILDMLFTLGWFGAIPYLGTVFFVVLITFRYTEARFDTFMATARAISFSTFAQFGLTSSTSGINGMIFWGFLGLTLAAHRYHLNQKALKTFKGIDSVDLNKTM